MCQMIQIIEFAKSLLLVHQSTKRVSHSPVGAVATIAGIPETNGRVDGPSLSASFNRPRGIVYNPRDGSIFVADCGNNLIRNISAQGKLLPSVPNKHNCYRNGNNFCWKWKHNEC